MTRCHSKLINTSGLDDEELKILFLWPESCLDETLLQILVRIRTLTGCKTQEEYLKFLSILLEDNPGLGRFTMREIAQSLVDGSSISI